MLEILAKLLRGLAAGLMAAGMILVDDTLTLAPVEPEDFDALAVLARRLALTGLVGGALMGLASVLAVRLRKVGARLGRRPNLLPSIVITLALSPYAAYLAGQLLSGGAVSRTPGIELLRIAGPALMTLLFLPVIIVVLKSAEQVSRSGGRKIAAALALVAAAVAADLTDRLAYQGLYLYLHDFLFFACFAALILALLLLWPRGRGGMTVAVLLVTAGGLMAWGDRIHEPTGNERSVLFRETRHGRRMIALWRRDLSSSPGLMEGLALDADFQAERRQVGLRLSDARIEFAARAGAEGVKNVLWVTVDTLRSDRMSAYGYERRTTPALKKLAERSVRFDRHYAQFPITSFSFQSMFFGRYPSATPLFRLARRLPDDAGGNKTLARQLGDAGIRTISFPAIDPASLSHPHYAVLAEGFDEVNPQCPEQRKRDAADQVDQAVRRLGALQDERFFMWIHIMDPHHEYLLHDDFRFGKSAADRYDSEIAYTDQALGRLMQRLRTLGLAENTAVIVNSDHGEAFGEHNTTHHGSTLYDEQLRVPCIVHVPGLAPQRVGNPTNNIDLMPTVLDLMAVESKTPVQGQSLLGYLMDGDSSPVAPLPFAFAEIPDAIPEMSPANTNKQMIVSGRYKLLANMRDRFVELYDMVNDPAELVNIAEREPERRDQLLAMVKSLMEESRNTNLPEGARSEEEILESLRQALKGGTVPARCDLLSKNLSRRSPKMAEIALERLNDPEEHYLVKMMILEQGGELLGEKVLPYIRTVLHAPPALGAATLALDLWLERGLPLEGTDRELVAANMQRHPHVGWRAACLLAAHGDSRAKMHLLPALELGDRETAFASACGLGLVEDGEGLKRLHDDFVFFSLVPERCAESIRALTALRDKAMAARVTELVRSRYQHHKVKLAALEYFAMVGGEDAVPGLLYLSTGWDPEVDRLVFEKLRSLYGEEKAATIRANGRRISEIADCLTQGRLEDAMNTAFRIVEEVGSVRETAPFALIAGGLALRLGLTDRGSVVLRELADVRAPAVYRKAARALRTAPREKSYKVEVLGVSPVETGPLPAGAERRFSVRLRNAGKGMIPGGDDPAGLGVSVTFEGPIPPGRRLRPSATLPVWGLPPGATCDVVVLGQVPSEGQFYTLGARVYRRDKQPLKLLPRSQPAAMIRVANPAAGGLPPERTVYKGETLLRDWLPSRAFNPAVLNPDKSVACLAIKLDPQIISPVFAPGTKKLRVVVDFNNEKHPDTPDELFEVYYRYEGQPHFLGHQRVDAAYKIDGKRRRLTFELPLRDGKSPVQVRLDPYSVAHLIVLHEIIVEPY